ncbi:MAG: glycosyltransferase family 2 protein [Candidatus Omnitrophota bacterium]|nr:MAG: glycosyltransferase family 2 protein [Candidatus Omnitrophota bacterium]
MDFYDIISKMSGNTINTKDKLKVSVIITTYSPCINSAAMRGQQLFNLLTQLLRQTIPADEIIVVDQTPEYPPQIGELFKQLDNKKIHFIAQEEPSITKARNRGLKESKGDIIIYIDDDVRIKEDFISAHLTNYSDESIDGVCGQVLCPSQPEPTPPLPNTLTFSYPFGFIHFPFRSSRRSESILLVGTNFSIRKKTLFSVGGFDENLALDEDMELSWRLHCSGAHLVFDPVASVFHLEMQEGGLSKITSLQPIPTIQHFQSFFYYYIKSYLNKYPVHTLWHFTISFRKWIMNKSNICRPQLLGKVLWRFILALGKACYLIIKGPKLL